MVCGDHDDGDRAWRYRQAWRAAAHSDTSSVRRAAATVIGRGPSRKRPAHHRLGALAGLETGGTNPSAAQRKRVAKTGGSGRRCPIVSLGLPLGAGSVNDTEPGPCSIVRDRPPCDPTRWLGRTTKAAAGVTSHWAEGPLAACREATSRQALAFTCRQRRIAPKVSMPSPATSANWLGSGTHSWTKTPCTTYPAGFSVSK